MPLRTVPLRTVPLRRAPGAQPKALVQLLSAIGLIVLTSNLGACTSASAKRTLGAGLIAGGVVAVGAGTTMAAAGADSRPRILVLYGPGEAPPGWDPGGGMESPALFVSGLVLLGLGVASMFTGGVMFPAEDVAEPEPQPPVISAGL